jgi:hypothetical protein
MADELGLHSVLRRNPRPQENPEIRVMIFIRIHSLPILDDKAF